MTIQAICTQSGVDAAIFFSNVCVEFFEHRILDLARILIVFLLIFQPLTRKSL